MTICRERESRSSENKIYTMIYVDSKTQQLPNKFQWHKVGINNKRTRDNQSMYTWVSENNTLHACSPDTFSIGVLTFKSTGCWGSNWLRLVAACLPLSPRPCICWWCGGAVSLFVQILVSQKHAIWGLFALNKDSWCNGFHSEKRSPATVFIDSLLTCPIEFPTEFPRIGSRFRCKPPEGLS